MKRKLLFILALEAIACLALYLARTSWPELVTSVLAFPFEQIGYGLRSLSLSGAVGNGFAVALYVILSLLPAAACLALLRRRHFQLEDALLPLASVVLFIVLYCMINPSVLGAYFGRPEAQPLAKAIMGGSVYAVLAGYLLLRVRRHLFAADLKKMRTYLSALLVILSVVLVYLVFGAGFGGLLDDFAALYAGNTQATSARSLSAVFLVLGWLADSLPYLLDIMIIFAALALLRALVDDRYADAALAAASRLAHLCGVSLVATILTNVGFNLLNLLFIKRLLVVDHVVQIPLFSILFTLAALLLAQFIRENKRLKDDNDLFI